MVRDFLLKTIIQRLKNLFLVIGMAIIILIALMSLYAQAADVNVYAEGIYTDDYPKVDIYADINAKSILSFGVKLTYFQGLLLYMDMKRESGMYAYKRVKN
ncbi:MAG: hypothetical protein ACMUHX_05110 [bacterium]